MIRDRDMMLAMIERRQSGDGSRSAGLSDSQAFRVTLQVLVAQLREASYGHDFVANDMKPNHLRAFTILEWHCTASRTEARN